MVHRAKRRYDYLTDYDGRAEDDLSMETLERTVQRVHALIAEEAKRSAASRAFMKKRPAAHMKFLEKRRKAYKKWFENQKAKADFGSVHDRV